MISYDPAPDSANPYAHPLIADKVFPVVDVSAKRIEYKRETWVNPMPPTRWQRESARLQHLVRSARRHAARLIAGDQWPSEDRDW